MKRSFMTDFTRFTKLCGKYGGRLWMISIVSSLVSGTLGAIFQAQTLKYITAYFIEKQDNALRLAFLMIALTLLVGCVLRPLLNYWSQIIISKITAAMRVKLFDHLNTLPSSYFSGTHSGDVAARINGDVDAFSKACDTVISFLGALLPAFTVIPYMMTLDMRMAGIIVGIGILFLLLTVKVIMPLRNRQQKVRAEIAKLSVAATESITGFNVIRTNNLEQQFGQNFKQSAKRLLDTQVKYSNLEAVVGSLGILIWTSGQALTAIFGLLFVFAGTLAVANLSALVSVSSNVIRIFTDFSSLPIQLQQAFAGVDRIYEQLAITPEPERYPTNGVTGAARTGISVQHLCFSYNGTTNVLEDIHLDVQKGQTIALVGDSGSGKTTLVKILASLYRATSGEVTVLGRPLNDYTLEEYREQIAYVPQNAYVFDGSIRENIAYGKEIDRFEEVVMAARSANAESFILQKPDQYETLVGERGIQLSGGERQRLAIARAIYKNADILLLDEATSSLDGESELAIQLTLDQLMKKHTCVVVAHRLSTITGADCIYFMRGGKIISSGRHEQILATCPEYEELYYKKFQSQAT